MKFEVGDIIGQKFYESTNQEVMEAIDYEDEKKVSDLTSFCKNTKTKNSDP